MDDVSRELEQWLRQIDPEAATEFISNFRFSQEKDAENHSIRISFRSIAKEKADRAALGRDDACIVTYDLRISGPDPLRAQRLHSLIYFAAAAGGPFTLPPPDSSTDTQPARPGVLTLRARLVQPHEATPARIVTEPLGLHLRALGRINGVVVGPTGAPIVRAQVEARTLNRRTVSDAGGRFSIPGAPAAGPVSLSVSARGKSIDLSIDAAKQAEVVIVMPMEEEHA